MLSRSRKTSSPDQPVHEVAGPAVDRPRKGNSLNLFRLVLAVLVLVSHAYPIAGRPEPTWQGEHLGTWAVAGFFVISGYLITGSRMRTHFSEFLVHRIARIFPAFVVSLLVTVIVIAPVGYWRVNGSLEAYLTTPNTPLNYVVSNLFLRIPDYSIAGTPSSVPLVGTWNGSLWTLYYEFLCYLVVGVLALLPVVKRSPVPIAVVFVLSVLAHANIGELARYFGPNVDVLFLAPLLPYFLGGALVYVLRDTIPTGAVVGIGAGILGVVAILLEPRWGGQAAAPFLTVAILWLSTVVPSPAVLRTHDISYGVYIYTFPLQQILVLAGLHRTMWLFMLLTLVAVTVPATASWLLVERPIMRRVRTYDTDRVRRSAQIAQEEPAM